MQTVVINSIFAHTKVNIGDWKRNSSAGQHLPESEQKESGGSTRTRVWNPRSKRHEDVIAE